MCSPSSNPILRRYGLRPRLQFKWDDLPQSLLCEISRRLTLIDYLSFHLVCKSWYQSKSQSTSLFATAIRRSFFLVYDFGDDEESKSNCYLYDIFPPPSQSSSSSSHCNIIRIPELANSTCLASGPGWLLLLQRGGERVFFFNLFTSNTVELPPLPSIMWPAHSYRSGFTFDSTPSRVDFHVTIRCFGAVPNGDVISATLNKSSGWRWKTSTESTAEFKERMSRREPMPHIRDATELVELLQKSRVWEHFATQRKLNEQEEKRFTVSLCAALVSTSSIGGMGADVKTCFPKYRYSFVFSGSDGDAVVERIWNGTLPMLKGVVIEAKMPRFPSNTSRFHRIAIADVKRGKRPRIGDSPMTRGLHRGQRSAARRGRRKTTSSLPIIQ